MIDQLVELLVMPFVVTIVAAFARVACEPDFVVGGVDRNGKITCIEKIKITCCGEPTGVVCEKPCPKSAIKYKRVYCTGGSKPIVVDHTTVGCTR